MRKVSILLVLLAMSLISLAQVQPQQQKQPDSIQVYQTTALPQSIDAAIKIVSGKFRPKDKSGTYADSVLFESVINYLNIPNGKMINIVNPNAPKKPEVKKK